MDTSTSSSTNGCYPYPTHPRPTPYQIFHLSPGASQKDVKSRYYDLVRIYHPDSGHNRLLDLSQQVKHERFRSITNAYEILSGKKSGLGVGEKRDRTLREEIERRRRRANVYADIYGSSYPGGGGPRAWTANPDDRDHDTVLLIVGVLCLFVALAPTFVWTGYKQMDEHHLSASANLARARREAREFGNERREEIKKRVKQSREGQKNEEEHKHSES